MSRICKSRVISDWPMTSFIFEKIDAILGASIFWSLLWIGQVKLGKYQPMLQKTHLGIVSGDLAERERHNSSICCFSSKVQLHDKLERFWRIEEVEIQLGQRTKKIVRRISWRRINKMKQDIFHRQFSVQRFEELAESYKGALRRLYKLEQYFNKDPQLKDDYVQFMEEYIKLNHMMNINAIQEESVIAHYIPHHPVMTTINNRRKLRVVFDASVKTSSGKSLNDILLVGPIIQQTLFSIVLHFRQYQYVPTADVIKMYCQVNIIEEQRNLQQILWRSRSDEPVQAYKLNTVTYGVLAAPFLAIQSTTSDGAKRRWIPSRRGSNNHTRLLRWWPFNGSWRFRSIAST